MTSATTSLRRPKSLTQELVQNLSGDIREQRIAVGDKLETEAEIMGRFGVSRTVVREAISRMQAAGLVETRHGIGTFVLAPPDNPAFRVSADQLATLRDVVALIELRISVETEAAALAAVRRLPEHLQAMRGALDAFGAAIEAGADAVGADFDFHQAIARATQNHYFLDLMQSVGTSVFPRRRLQSFAPESQAQQDYLRRINQEHESIFNAIAAQDSEAARAAMRTHLSNSRDRLKRDDGAHRP